ncbi:MAG: IS6 family transposase [Acetobacteraceae bacterium]|nr:MAG: IS6 family transposase [Acetobacteraceae bacterium]
MQLGGIVAKLEHGKAAAGESSSESELQGRQFTAEVILRAVRWYLMFPISYRDVEFMLQDRGVNITHTTIFRWIQAYTLELERRIRPHLHPSNGSWRVDETYVRVKGRWTYLYRMHPVNTAPPGYPGFPGFGGAFPALRSSSMICFRLSMPSGVKAVTPSSPTP